MGKSEVDYIFSFNYDAIKFGKWSKKTYKKLSIDANVIKNNLTQTFTRSSKWYNIGFSFKFREHRNEYGIRFCIILGNRTTYVFEKRSDLVNGLVNEIIESNGTIRWQRVK